MLMLVGYRGIQPMLSMARCAMRCAMDKVGGYKNPKRKNFKVLL